MINNNEDKQKVRELLEDIANACDGFILDRNTHTSYPITRKSARKLILYSVYVLSFMMGCQESVYWIRMGKESA